MDVVGLYNNIPLRDGLKACQLALDQRDTCDLLKASIVNLAILVLELNAFQVEEKFFCKFTALPLAHAWLPVCKHSGRVYFGNSTWHWHHSSTVASLMMILESGHTARTHCCSFSIMQTAAIETLPSRVSMESRSHIWIIGQPLRRAKSSPTYMRSQQTHISTYCQQVTILNTSDYAFVWSSASRKPSNSVRRNCPRFWPRVAILKVLLLSSLIVFAKIRGKLFWTAPRKGQQSKTITKQELHLCADGVLSCPRCNVYWRVPSPSFKGASEWRSSLISRSWRTGAQRTLEIFWYRHRHLSHPVTKTLLMAQV